MVMPDAFPGGFSYYTAQLNSEPGLRDTQLFIRRSLWNWLALTSKEY
jgi:hypothetical protein